jgi:hypothetical protein
MMPRYFDLFFVDEPMTELLEEEARALPSYVVEANAGTIRRMEVWLHGELERVIYPESQPGLEVAELQRTRDAGVSTWITSPVTRDADAARYTIWYYAPGGGLDHRTECVNSSERSVSTWYGADGQLGGSRERRYNEQGEQIEVIETTPDGRRIIVKL